MKMTAERMIAVMILAGALVGCQSFETSADDLRFYVSPHGLDTNPGTKRQPFATLQKARDAVRAARQEYAQAASATILLSDGTHRLTEPLVLTPQDSDLSFKAAPGARPVVSGGTRISGWRKHNDKLWVADVPWLTARPEPFTQLFVNGVRRPCARTPDEGAYLYTKRLTLTHGNPGQCLGFSYNAEDTLPWLGQDGARVVLFHNWVNSYNRVKTIDPAMRRVTFARPAGIFFLGPEVRYYVENSFDALDAPGEWYADKAKGQLYYYPMPGECMDTAEVVAPLLTSSLIVIKGNLQDKDAVDRLVFGTPHISSSFIKIKGREFVDRLVFKGITFQHTDANLAPDYPHSVQGAHTQRGVIFATGLRASEIKDCTFTQLGEHGVSLREGCSLNSVQRCHFHDLGGGGVYLSEGAPANIDERHLTARNLVGQEPDSARLAASAWYLTARNTIDNNFIHDGGRIFRAACGVFLGGSASYNHITHNEICDLSWVGVHLGWSWTGRAPAHTHHNEVGHNHIHHIGNGVLNDIGGIYTLGVSPGTYLHHNHIHDVTRFTRGREGYGGWGIYLDAGSSQIIIADNVVHDTQDGGLHLHNYEYPWDNIAINNIFAFSQNAEILRNATMDSEKRHIALQNNIVYGPSPRPLGGIWKKDGNFNANNNLYWSTTTNAPDFCGRTFAEWQAEGHDTDGRVADPRFVNPDARDFRLRRGSPALAMGFKPIDFASIGLYGNRAWTRLPKTIQHRPCETAEAPPTSLVLRQDFEEELAGDLPDFAQVFEENTQAVARVVAAGVATPTQCLRVTDGPGQQHAHNPHICYYREFPDGLLRGAFDLRHETGAEIIYEWRDWPEGEPYRSGPTIRVNADGSLSACGKTLAKLPPGQWVHIEVLCETGAQADGTWQLAITLPEQAEQRFTKLSYNPAFKRPTWLGFISMATDTTVFYLDNIVIEPAK